MKSGDLVPYTCYRKEFVNDDTSLVFVLIEVQAKFQDKKVGIERAVGKVMMVGYDGESDYSSINYGDMYINFDLLIVAS